MMTRKDYVKTAAILSNYLDGEISETELVNSFADYFASDNSSFNRTIFMKAVGI